MGIARLPKRCFYDGEHMMPENEHVCHHFFSTSLRNISENVLEKPNRIEKLRALCGTSNLYCLQNHGTYPTANIKFPKSQAFSFTLYSSSINTQSRVSTLNRIFIF
jgi:hypothetical protein